jgi:hypothetical protein
MSLLPLACFGGLAVGGDFCGYQFSFEFSDPGAQPTRNRLFHAAPIVSSIKAFYGISLGISGI